MRDQIYKFYHKLQQNERFLGFVAWLQEHYITIIIGDVVNAPRIIKERRNPEKYLSKSRKFFNENKGRVKNMCDLLADEKSRKQYIAAIKFRTERRRIRHNEWSLTDQYFPKDIVHIRPDEVFIDGGAYNGDTIHKLLKITSTADFGGRIRIVAFEPGKLNMTVLKRKYGSDSHVMLKNSGLSDKNGELYFYEQGSSSYLTTKEGANSVVTVSAIDEVPECKDATWIKMDIEGAEMDALEGARETIIRNKPTLTICIYHSDEDMIRIAEWVHDLEPEYKLYVRQHTRRNHETVLYAVM